MGRKKKQTGEGATYLTFGAYAEELAAIDTVMTRWRCSQSMAIRLLITYGIQYLRTAGPQPGPEEEPS